MRLVFILGPLILSTLATSMVVDEAVTAPEKDPCDQDFAVIGRCRMGMGRTPAFSFNKEEGKCEKFLHNGCRVRGNKNRFDTLAACQDKCEGVHINFQLTKEETPAIEEEEEEEGEDPDDGSGADPDDGPGADPDDGPGEDPDDGPGADPDDGPGEDPDDGPGADPDDGLEVAQGSSYGRGNHFGVGGFQKYPRQIGGFKRYPVGYGIGAFGGKIGFGGKGGFGGRKGYGGYGNYGYGGVGGYGFPGYGKRGLGGGKGRFGRYGGGGYVG